MASVRRNFRLQEDAAKVYVVLWIYANAVCYDRFFNPWKGGLCFSTNLQSFKVSKFVHLSLLQPKWQRCFTKSLWMTLELVSVCVAQKAVSTGPVASCAPRIIETRGGRSSCWPVGKAR